MFCVDCTSRALSASRRELTGLLGSIESRKIEIGELLARVDYSKHLHDSERIKDMERSVSSQSDRIGTLRRTVVTIRSGMISRSQLLEECRYVIMFRHHKHHVGRFMIHVRGKSKQNQIHSFPLISIFEIAHSSIKR